ncbi:MAG TPA: signal recognition particle protein [Pirellulales bacterium]|nr:signal recognition particle protein [Pirellulales bacterium]
MFDSLQHGLQSAFRTLTGKARLTEANMRDGLQLVRQALLEADVSVDVVKEFMGRVTEQAVGEQVLRSLRPEQQVVGIVHQELVNLMGPVDHSLHLRGDVTVLMLCGLQGSGKTTTCGKLGRLIHSRGRKPLLVAADLQRPAAVEQLQVIGQQLGLPVYAEAGSADPVAVCQNATRHAREIGAQVVILDTAGRLHIDDELMEQLKRIDRRVEPEQVYLVVDAMTGQDAVNSAKAFNEALELDGVIMTKLDGDARGGAALSVKQVTGVPIKFMGVGEHLDALEEFHPERMAGRILGMGDIVSLVEQAQQKIDQEEMQRLEERTRKGEFTLEDFRNMITQTRRMGPLNKLMGLIPGMGGMKEMMGDIDAEGDMNRLCGIIDSMTPDERRNPSRTIDASRRRRIAAGAGVDPAEISQLVKQFDGIADVMKRISGMGMRDRMREVQQLQKKGVFDPGGMLAKQKKGTGKRLTSDERNKLRKQREKEARKRMRAKKQR